MVVVEIVSPVQAIAKEVEAGKLSPEAIDEDLAIASI